MKKLVALLLAAMMLLASVAALAETPEGYPEVVESMIQAEPITLTIYDYWSGNGDRVAEPDEQTQLTYDYRDWIEATYNVKIQQMQGGDWGTCAEEMINFTSAPDGSLRAYIIEPGKVGSLVNNGVAASWGDYDLSAEKWNQASINMWKKDGNVYGVSTGAHEPRGLLYFNKRVLEEAGIDWNTIYDMQAAGTWTWAKLEEMVKTLTRDVDNDGVNDIWGLVGSADDLFCMAVFTNGGTFFDYDAEGKLQPTMNSDATINALNWSRDIYNTYWMPTPEGANWDWYKEQWKTGNIGFYCYQAYGGISDNETYELVDMEDEYGIVAFPVPNEGDNYITTVSENITLIPNVYDAETVKKICFFIDLWTNDAPGVDAGDAWIGNKYNCTDERGIDETYAMLRQASHGIANLVVKLGTQNDILGESLLWNLGANTPAELIEAGMPAWQAYCDTFNAK